MASISDTAKLRTANGTLQVGMHNPIDATSGAITAYLPEARYGERLSVEKTDTSANPVNISGTLRRGDALEPLILQGQVLELLCDSGGFWWPLNSNFNLSTLDTRFGTSTALTADLSNPGYYQQGA